MTADSLYHKLRNNKALSPLFSQETLTNLVRYLISGFIAFGAEYSLFAILYSYFNLSDIASNSAAMTTGFILSFTLNRFWSFKSRDNVIKQLLLFGSLFIINLCISNVSIHFLSINFGLTPLVSKILIMGAIVVWNFIIYKKIIYRR